MYIFTALTIVCHASMPPVAVRRGLVILFWVAAVMADTTYIVDDMDPSVQYAGQWDHESDYNAEHNLTMSNALQQDGSTTLSIRFYGELLKVAVNVLLIRLLNAFIRNQHQCLWDN